MGRKSIREDKTRWQLSRERAGFTRETASEQLAFITEDRIEKIESGRSPVRPEEVLAMSKCYREPELCNYYCSNECPIGRSYVPEVKVSELEHIVLEALAALKDFEKEKDRLIEISADGTIDSEEQADFEKIRRKLERVTGASEAMRLWAGKNLPEQE